MQQCCLGLKAVWLVYLLSLLGCWLFIREVVPEVRQEVEIDDNNVFAVGLVDAVRDTADLPSTQDEELHVCESHRCLCDLCSGRHEGYYDIRCHACVMQSRRKVRLYVQYKL